MIYEDEDAEREARRAASFFPILHDAPGIEPWAPGRLAEWGLAKHNEWSALVRGDGTDALRAISAYFDNEEMQARIGALTGAVAAVAFVLGLFMERLTDPRFEPLNEQIATMRAFQEAVWWLGPDTRRAMARWISEPDGGDGGNPPPRRPRPTHLRLVRPEATDGERKD